MTDSLFWRALGAFIALPVVFGFVVPWLLHPVGVHQNPIGIALWGIGTILLLWCAGDLYLAGRRPRAPWAPPDKPVVIGLHRVSRNPVYVAVLIILCGWAVAFASPILWSYAAGIAVAFHLRIVTHDEPLLLDTYGDAWLSYRARVRRWI